jgi:cyclohexanecarboxylate-CoA ligase
MANRWRPEYQWPNRTIDEDMRRAAREHPDAPVVFHRGNDGRDDRPDRHDSADHGSLNHAGVRQAGLSPITTGSALTTGPMPTSGPALTTTTLSELFSRGEQAAVGFQRLGLRPGDALAIQVPNWVEGAIAHIAGWLAGAIVVPIVPIYGPREVGFILRQSSARIFVVAGHWGGRDRADLLIRLGELPALSAVVVIGERPAAAIAEQPAAATASYSIIAWDRLDAVVAWSSEPESPTSLEPPAVDPHDTCLLVYTSGTTADPKGVRHSHNTLLTEVHAMAALRDSRPDTVALAAFPSGHVAGVLGLLRLLVLATPTVVMDSWDAAVAARLVAEHRVTTSSGAPVYLATLLDEAERSGRDLTSLAEYLTGAANVSPALIERADRAGIAAYRSYGSSEHPTISSGLPADPLVKRATTDGRVTPGNEVRIVDGDGRDLPGGTDGEIIVRGPEQFLGYQDAALDAESFFPGGWLRTGDIGHLDVDAYLTVTGRKKDIIVRGGEKISAKEVEDLLLGHPAVAEAAVVGAPDERYGERVCAFVVPRPGESLDLPEVARHFAQAGLARQKTPERLVLADALPRTAAGKVRKHLLRDQLQEE